MTREETAAALAEALGWKVAHVAAIAPWSYFVVDEEFVAIHAADAPLHEHLEFVGRLALALGCGWGNVEWSDETCVVIFITPWGAHRFQGEAPDLSHAAMNAALAAKKGDA